MVFFLIVIIKNDRFGRRTTPQLATRRVDNLLWVTFLIFRSWLFTGSLALQWLLIFLLSMFARRNFQITVTITVTVFVDRNYFNNSKVNEQILENKTNERNPPVLFFSGTAFAGDLSRTKGALSSSFLDLVSAGGGAADGSFPRRTVAKDGCP